MQQAARINRIKRELSQLSDHPPPGISCWSTNNNIDELSAQIVPGETTPYSGGLFHLDIRLPERYPFEPPNISFCTPIYHPNIDSAGRICLESLKMPPQGNWSPAMNIGAVLQTIVVLMAEPNPSDPLMVDIAREFQFDRSRYEQTAREWTKTHAMGSTVSGSTMVKNKEMPETQDCGENNEKHVEKVKTNSLHQEIKETKLESLACVDESSAGDLSKDSTVGTTNHQASSVVSGSKITVDNDSSSISVAAPENKNKNRMRIGKKTNSEVVDSSKSVALATKLADDSKNFLAARNLDAGSNEQASHAAKSGNDLELGENSKLGHHDSDKAGEMKKDLLVTRVMSSIENSSDNGKQKVNVKAGAQSKFSRKRSFDVLDTDTNK